MRMKAWGILLLTLLLIGSIAPAAAQQTPTKEAVGEAIFFDEALSINENQSCATCHDPEWGWTGSDTSINGTGAVYEGSIPGRFGDRKPPSSAYATVSPIFHQDKKGLFIGGNFWDGRATGEKLGNPAADQAQGPFLNPAEQALPDSACVVWKVCTSIDYGLDFKAVWGDASCAITWPGDIAATCATEGTSVTLTDADRATAAATYDNIALSIAAFENTTNDFSSKFDLGKLTKEEKKGLALFKGKAGCKACHPIAGKDPLFTDFSFDNLGIPTNPDNPAYLADNDFVDPGLGGFLANLGYPQDTYQYELGKFKVPTLRNVDLRPTESDIKAFGHNGYFKSLEGIVHFYNTRDIKPACSALLAEADALAAGCWPVPEFPDNVNDDELGDLGLTAEEEAAIVAFLRTLSDGWTP